MLAEDVERDPEAVLSNCDKHLRLNQHDLLAHGRKGMTLILLGRSEEGEASLRQMVELLPELQDPLELVLQAARFR